MGGKVFFKYRYADHFPGANNKYQGAQQAMWI